MSEKRQSITEKKKATETFGIIVGITLCSCLLLLAVVGTLRLAQAMLNGGW